MAILDRSPELVVAQRRRRQGKRHSQDSRPAPFSQYAGMGISLGTAAGVLLVLFCSPNGNCAAAVDRASFTVREGFRRQRPHPQTRRRRRSRRYPKLLNQLTQQLNKLSRLSRCCLLPKRRRGTPEIRQLPVLRRMRRNPIVRLRRRARRVLALPWMSQSPMHNTKRLSRSRPRSLTQDPPTR